MEWTVLSTHFTPAPGSMIINTPGAVPFEGITAAGMKTHGHQAWQWESPERLWLAET